MLQRDVSIPDSVEVPHQTNVARGDSGEWGGANLTRAVSGPSHSRTSGAPLPTPHSVNDSLYSGSSQTQPQVSFDQFPLMEIVPSQTGPVSMNSSWQETPVSGELMQHGIEPAYHVQKLMGTRV